MPKLSAAFFDHPASVGETYGQHMGAALSFGVRMIVSGLACLLHGLLPFLFVKTGSDTICTLHDEMVVRRLRRDPTAMPLHEPNDG